MITDPKLHAKIDQLWDKLWTGGLANPMDAIEQLSFLLFLKRLEDEENRREKLARISGEAFTPRVPAEMRWSYWTNLKAEEALRHVRDVVFPWLRSAGATGSSFERYMATAEFKISKANLLIEAARSIDGLEISQQHQDVQGDLYEYLLAKLNTAGRNGQFRTPRHIIRMMVQMVDPRPMERVGDLAAGTCGFLVNAYQYILEGNTSADILTYDSEGWPHNLVGDRLSAEEREYLQKVAFRGYDNDAGMTMLRIGSMNLMLHGIEFPRFYYMDTLSKGFKEKGEYDVILMNPPFKGAVDKADVSPDLPSNTTKSELLFLHLVRRVLDMGGRAVVIVPDGVLFGSSRAHVETRKMLIEENGLQGVVSMPSGVFRPYAGVSTAVLLFTRGAKTERIWFYDMEHDGFSLDDKRLPVAENDVPDILERWRNRHSETAAAEVVARMEELRVALAPLKVERLERQANINRLTFESAIAAEDDGEAQVRLEEEQRGLRELEERIHPLQQEFNRLSRQFWVTKDQVRANGYDLSASRYRQVERDEVFNELPHVTLDRLLKLDATLIKETQQLQELLK